MGRTGRATKAKQRWSCQGFFPRRPASLRPSSPAKVISASSHEGRTEAQQVQSVILAQSPGDGRPFGGMVEATATIFPTEQVRLAHVEPDVSTDVGDDLDPGKNGTGPYRVDREDVVSQYRSGSSRRTSVTGPVKVTPRTDSGVGVWRMVRVQSAVTPEAGPWS